MECYFPWSRLQAARRTCACPAGMASAKPRPPADCLAPPGEEAGGRGAGARSLEASGAPPSCHDAPAAVHSDRGGASFHSHSPYGGEPCRDIQSAGEAAPAGPPPIVDPMDPRRGENLSPMFAALLGWLLQLPPMTTPAITGVVVAGGCVFAATTNAPFHDTSLGDWDDLRRNIRDWGAACGTDAAIARRPDCEEPEGIAMSILGDLPEGYDRHRDALFIVVVKLPPARRSGSVAGVTGACVCDGSGVKWPRVG